MLISCSTDREGVILIRWSIGGVCWLPDDYGDTESHTTADHWAGARAVVARLVTARTKRRGDVRGVYY